MGDIIIDNKLQKTLVKGGLVDRFLGVPLALVYQPVLVLSDPVDKRSLEAFFALVLYLRLLRFDIDTMFDPEMISNRGNCTRRPVTSTAVPDLVTPSIALFILWFHLLRMRPCLYSSWVRLLDPRPSCDASVAAA